MNTGFTNRKKDHADGEESNIRLGWILLDTPEFDWNAFIRNLNGDWSIKVDSCPTEDGQLFFVCDDMMVACGLALTRLPDGEAEQHAKNNWLWKDAGEVLRTHRAYVSLSVMQAEDAFEQSWLFTQVATSMLKLDNAIAIYQPPAMIPGGFYIQQTEKFLKEDKLPVLNWVYIGIYQDDENLSGYTCGLHFFGKDEVEVLRTSRGLGDLYLFLVEIASYIIESDVVLEDGDTVNFSKEENLSITRSRGVAVKGETLKVAYGAPGF